MQLQIITPEKTLFAGDAAMVTVPGTDGEFGVLPGHSHVISTLEKGEVVIDFEGSEQKRIAIASGVAEVTPEKVVLLVQIPT